MRIIDADKILADRGKIITIMGEDYYHNTVVRYAPTIDAVEVVRCCDCKYFTDSYIACDGYRCKPRCDLANGLKIPSKDTFCSYGKRKE